MRKSQRKARARSPHPHLPPARTVNSRHLLMWGGGGLLVFVVVGFILWHQLRTPPVGPVLSAVTPPAVPISNLPTNAAPRETKVTEPPINRPDSPPSGAKDATAIELNQQANKLLGAGDLKGAIELYQKAVALAPTDEDLHYNLGIAYARAGESDQAEKEYRQALKLLPDYAEVHNNLGNLLLRQGRLNEAEGEFTNAISIMPEYAAAHNNLGIVRQRQKRVADAMACFQKAVQYDTNYFEAHFNLASSYILEHEKDKALAELHEVLRINPTFEPAQRAVAMLTGQASKPAP